jgi:hypothetical protein
MCYSLDIPEVGILEQWILSLPSAIFFFFAYSLMGISGNKDLECKPGSVPNLEIRTT